MRRVAPLCADLRPFAPNCALLRHLRELRRIAPYCAVLRRIAPIAPMPTVYAKKTLHVWASHLINYLKGLFSILQRCVQQLPSKESWSERRTSYLQRNSTKKYTRSVVGAGRRPRKIIGL
jgi:hypothetical protein